jgi:hypothetical protein
VCVAILHNAYIHIVIRYTYIHTYKHTYIQQRSTGSKESATNDILQTHCTYITYIHTYIIYIHTHLTYIHTNTHTYSNVAQAPKNPLPTVSSKHTVHTQHTYIYAHTYTYIQQRSTGTKDSASNGVPNSRTHKHDEDASRRTIPTNEPKSAPQGKHIRLGDDSDSDNESNKDKKRKRDESDNVSTNGQKKTKDL